MPRRVAAVAALTCAVALPTAVADGGRHVYLSNDSDVGVDHVTNDAAPWRLGPKLLPSGAVDTGELLAVDLAKVPARFRG